MHTIDLRSDTITQPTQTMRQAMAEAEVGDDVMGDDPTINELQAVAADRMGMESALLVPSGTMANQIATWVHTARQGQVVCHENCHLTLYEGGGLSMIAGVMPRTVSSPDGRFSAEAIRHHFGPDDPHFAQTRMVAVENTHNWGGGTVWDPDRLAEVAALTHRRGAKLHIDGARIFNASVASGLPPSAWTANADSVMFCLSKGLSAPVGSVLCGSEAFIREARKVRKWLGGGMRQAGVLAAAGLVALDSMVDRLGEDHDNATRLARGLADVERLDLVADPETNIVYVDIARTGLVAEDFMSLMDEIGVRCLPRDTGSIMRFVTHRHVSGEDMDEAVKRVREVLA